MRRCGIIDLGSNTIRLVVYEVKKDRGERISKKDFSSLISTKKTAGLSSYVVDGRFSEAGIERATDILSDMLQRARVVHCDDIRIFATAVLRNCANSKEVVQAIEQNIGWRIDLLSGEDEARLDFVGASCDKNIISGTLIDIGGGSTELVQIADSKPNRMISIPLGSVSAYTEFVNHVLPTAKEMKTISKATLECLKSSLKDQSRKNQSGRENQCSTKAYQSKVLYGVGGSIRALGKLHAILLGREKQSKELSAEDINRMIDDLKSGSPQLAHAIAKAAPDRIHTIGCGLMILSRIMETLGAKNIIICKYGVREGYLLSHKESANHTLSEPS